MAMVLICRIQSNHITYVNIDRNSQEPNLTLSNLFLMHTLQSHKTMFNFENNTVWWKHAASFERRSLAEFSDLGL